MPDSNPYVNCQGARVFFGAPGKPKSRTWLDRQRTNSKFPKPFYFYKSDRPHWQIGDLQKYAESMASEVAAVGSWTK